MNRPLFKESGKWFIIAAIATTLGIAGFGWFAYAQLRSQAEQQAQSQAQSALQASPTAAQVSITAIGRLEPKDGIMKIAAPSSDSHRVSRLLVKEGDRVKAGQVIALMDNSDRLQSAVTEAEAAVQEAEQRLAQVRAGAKPADVEAERANVGRLEAELRQAERDYDRYQLLFKEGAIAESELDRRRLTVETVNKQLAQARRVLESVGEVRGVDIRLAQSEVNTAIARLERAQTERDLAIVRSPISGRVIRVHADAGEAVGESGILELGNTNQMYAVAEVYETDVGKIRVGQPAVITSSAFPNTTVKGTVDRIGLAVNRNDVLSVDPSANVDTRVVEVKIRLTDSRPVEAFTNLQVNVAIEP